MALSRTSTGALYRSDGSLTGWSGDTSQWSSVADPQFLCWPIAVMLGPNADTEVDGVREGQLYVEGDDWWLLYDAGNGTDGWRQFLAHSTDRGRTWTRLGALDCALSKVVSGSWAATATGWIEKRDGVYYLHRVVAAAAGSSPDTGLPAVPYYWDCWTNSSMRVSGWVASANVPTSPQHMTLSGAASSEFLPGSVVKSGSTYYGFAEINDGGGYKAGIATASNPDGPYTAPASAFADGSTTGFVSRIPENPKVFYSATLGRYVCLVNLIATSGTHTDANAVGYSASLTDWSGALWRMTQAIGPIDTTQAAVGLQTHVTGPDGALIEGPNGEVPIVYDTDPAASTPGWHRGRSLKSAMLEPSLACLRCNQSANANTYTLRRALSLTDFVFEHGLCVTGANGSGIFLGVEYRSDSDGSNCYRLILSYAGASLYKVVSGSASLLVNFLSTTVNYGAGWQHQRLQVEVVGNTHTVTFEGEPQISYTDSSSPIASGTHLGLTAKGVDVDIRNVTVRASNTLTITGLTPSSTGYLRSFGALPVTSFAANGSGVATVTWPHWPHALIEVAGVDHVTENLLLDGGDEVTLVRPSVAWRAM